jgi:hypothetical protein
VLSDVGVGVAVAVVAVDGVEKVVSERGKEVASSTVVVVDVQHLSCDVLRVG